MCEYPPVPRLIRQNGLYPLPMPRLVRQMGLNKIMCSRRQIMKKLLQFLKNGSYQINKIST